MGRRKGSSRYPQFVERKNAFVTGSPGGCIVISYPCRRKSATVAIIPNIPLANAFVTPEKSRVILLVRFLDFHW